MKSRCGSLTKRCDRSSFQPTRSATPGEIVAAECVPESLASAHKMNRKKRVLLVAMAGAALGGAGAFTVMAVMDQTYVPSIPYAPLGEPNRDVAVVYYSRSGHSEAAAREIARMFNAPITGSTRTIPAASLARPKPPQMRQRGCFRRSGSSRSTSLARAASSSYLRLGCSARRRRFGPTWSRLS